MDLWQLIPPLALGLDSLFGDPPGRPHPVRLIGNFLNLLETRARAWAKARPGHLKLAGIACVLCVAGGCGAAVYFLTRLPGAGWFIALYFAYAGLALQSLCAEVDKARRAVEEDGLEAGRQAVALLVSRDVSAASEDDLSRALAETLAENINDGVIAPFFWLCLAGPAGMWVYKAVSTMDSMWGYKSPDWRDLGWAAARLDDLLAWIPARISAAALWLMPVLPGSRSRPKWRDVAAQARQMSSPNAGWPMAMAAWRLERSMGGPTCYHGELVDKPRLGPESALPWDEDSLLMLLEHARRAALCACALMWLGCAGVKYLWVAPL